MGPVEYGDVTDAVHEGARGARSERAEERIAHLAVAPGRFHLDELVTQQGVRGLAGYCFGEAGRT